MSISDRLTAWMGKWYGYSSECYEADQYHEFDELKQIIKDIKELEE